MQGEKKEGENMSADTNMNAQKHVRHFYAQERDVS